MSIRLREVHEAHVLREVLHANGQSSDSVLAPCSRYWAAEQDGRALGVIGLELGERAGLLRSAAVLAEARGKKIGERLVACVEEAANRAGCALLYLFSTGAGAYWQRLGYESAEVDELVAALPDVPQVRRYASLGTLSSEVAWRKRLRG